MQQLRRAPFVSARRGPVRPPRRWPDAVRSRGGLEFTLPSILSHLVPVVPGAAQPLGSLKWLHSARRRGGARLRQLLGQHLSGLTTRWSEGLWNRDERR